VSASAAVKSGMATTPQQHRRDLVLASCWSIWQCCWDLAVIDRQERTVRGASVLQGCKGMDRALQTPCTSVIPM
jgi:hypothetical protein